MKVGKPMMVRRHHTADPVGGLSGCLVARCVCGRRSPGRRIGTPRAVPKKSRQSDGTSLGDLTLALTPLLAADDGPAKRLDDAAVVFGGIFRQRTQRLVALVWYVAF